MGEFLRKRRAALSPADVGLMDYGTRRVPGLRREEVAMMAGMSVTYYARLEQGQHINASDAVINSLGQALALTEVEKRHLTDLSGIRRVRTKAARSRPDQVRSGTKRLIESMHAVPAVCPRQTHRSARLEPCRPPPGRLTPGLRRAGNSFTTSKHDTDAVPRRRHPQPLPPVAH